ncbi:ATP-binding protein [Reinekea marina]|uniref:histidine kinase n=1 Tax=Reinekea marina TaxID=1310421 RepID=A0ABV7WTF7_9GAMM|nr:ATP-binding protein [Reinekea marina]MBU2862861.1 HAMP domain-containing protein [Reinekea forsetii]MDN3649119.1 ATP-binding protein [Reinekea marina]
MRPIRSLSHKLMISYVIVILLVSTITALIHTNQWMSPTAQVTLQWVMIICVIFGLHYYFRWLVLKPIRHLIAVTKELTQTTGSPVRAKRTQDDELGDLVNALNDLIDGIQSRKEIIIAERDRSALAHQQANAYAAEMRSSNRKLELEVQVRKRIETKLTEFQQFLNSIINSMPSAIIAIDQSLIVTQWNVEATHLTATSSSDAKGEHLVAAFPYMESHIDWLQESIVTKRTKTLRNVEYVKNHKTYLLDIVVYPLQQSNSNDAVIRIDDVTEKFRMEEIMIHSDKVMSLGGMASGMAHEINNPLSAIVQNAQNIARRIDPNLEANQKQAKENDLDLNRMHEYLKKRKVTAFLNNITESGVRASKLVTNMLQFSRSNDVSLSPCMIIDILENAINIALTDDKLYSIKGNFEMNIDQDFLAPEVWVSGVFTELEQVILNLIKNASHAIAERKQTLNDIDEGVINIHQSIENDYCLISISDNGIGMTPNTRKKVFEPFFTTKEVGVGTGLGLSVCYFIISTHHSGQLSVESEFGLGSVFEIRLPICHERPEKNTELGA